MAHHAAINYCLFEFHRSAEKTLHADIVLPWEHSSLCFSLPLSWVDHMVVIYLKIQAMFVFVVYHGSVLFSLRTRSDINRNSSIDLVLTRLSVAKLSFAIYITKKPIVPNALKHFNITGVFHWIQILKVCHTCGCVITRKCFCKAFDFQLIGASFLITHSSKIDILHLVSVCSECYTANGEDYRGFQNQTSLHGGKPCLFWNETFQHPYNTLKYPNGEGGLGRHNYCRWVLFLDLMFTYNVFNSIQFCLYSTNLRKKNRLTTLNI